MFAIKFNLDNISLLVFNISADLQFLHDSISSETPEMSENCWVIWKPPKIFDKYLNTSKIIWKPFLEKYLIWRAVSTKTISY